MKVFVLTFLIVASRHLLMSAWFNCAEDFHNHVDLESNKLGAIDMCFLLSYAIGNFILGVLGDSYRQKKVLWVSSSLSCLIYALVLKTQIILLSYFKLMNFGLYLVLFSLLGFAQSAIWPMTVAIMGMTNKKEVRGSVVGIWSVNSAVGDMVGYFLSSLLMTLGFDWVLVSFCTLVVFSAVVASNYCFLPDHISPTESKPRISVLAALQLPTVFYYCACYACVKLIHLSIMIWVPYFMYDYLEMDTKIGGLIMMLYSFGGILGGIFSGVISDKVPDRSYVLLGMTMASVPMINLLSFQLGKSDWLSCAFMMIVGFLVSGGSNFLSAVIAADMCDMETETEAKSTLTGLVDASGGIGASIGQILVIFTQIGFLGKENASSLFFIMIGSNIAAVVTILPVVSRAFNKKKYEPFDGPTKDIQINS